MWKQGHGATKASLGTVPGTALVSLAMGQVRIGRGSCAHPITTPHISPKLPWQLQGMGDRDPRTR